MCMFYIDQKKFLKADLDVLLSVETLSIMGVGERMDVEEGRYNFRI